MKRPVDVGLFYRHGLATNLSAPKRLKTTIVVTWIAQGPRTLALQRATSSAISQVEPGGPRRHPGISPKTGDSCRGLRSRNRGPPLSLLTASLLDQLERGPSSVAQMRRSHRAKLTSRKTDALACSGRAYREEKWGV